MKEIKKVKENWKLWNTKTITTWNERNLKAIKNTNVITKFNGKMKENEMNEVLRVGSFSTGQGGNERKLKSIKNAITKLNERN